MSERDGVIRNGLLFGAAYYAEYQQPGTLERDMDLMVAANFTVIRVGESVWSTWEPRDGEFDLEWLAPVLDSAHRHGIRVILGTPTYAVPPWLQRKHPEIASLRADGTSTPWGSRQEMDYSHPAYRWYAERIIRKVVARYADHPAVIGVQVDNEPGASLPHNPHLFASFLEWLRRRYGTVENLNEEWGLVYWSHRISEWQDLWAPGGNHMPQYQLEWRRFQAEVVNEFIGWQADIVREYARDDQFVTTCISYERPPVDDHALVRRLDVTAGNPYYTMQDGLRAGVEVPRTAQWWTSGVWALFHQGDRMFSSAQEPFLVTETNAQSIYTHWQNHPPYRGQLRQAALALVSRGARMIEYWHWHTLHFGAETYWGGILPHSQVPGRIYREATALGATLGAIAPLLDDYEPSYEAAILYSADTKWSFQFSPPLALDGNAPDVDSYGRITDSFVRGFFETGVQTAVWHVEQFLSQDIDEFVRRHPVLLAPALYVAGDDVLERLDEYARAGGHLIVGIRTGYGDHLARARREVAPAKLREAAGIWYEEYSNIPETIPVTGTEEFAVSDGSGATGWIDALIVDDAEVLASYEHAEFGIHPAVTTRPHGHGRVTYVGTVPNPELARSIAAWATPERESAEWNLPPEVTLSRGISSSHRVWFAHNWSPDPQQIAVPWDVEDAETHVLQQGASTVTLAPWGAQIFIGPHPDVIEDIRTTRKKEK